MLKRKIFTLLLLVNFFLFGVSSAIPTKAQEFDFGKAYQDYIYNLEVYRNSHDDYVFARSQYLNYQTLKSQSTAIDATKKMLQARDDVVVTYLTALRMRLREQDDVDDSLREELFLKIDVEIDWFNEHKETLTSAGSLTDLVADSNKASTRFKSLTNLFYTVLTAVSDGKINLYHKRLNQIYEELSDKFNKIKLEQREDYQFSRQRIQTIERWFLEVDNLLSRAEDKQKEATEKILYSKTRVTERSYGKAVTLLNESQQYLREASSYMAEIVREMTTAE